MTALAVTALAVTAGAGSASATTLELEGKTKNESVKLDFSLAGGNSTVISRTDGSLANTCAVSRMEGWTGTYTGTKVTTWVSWLSFESCERLVTVHFPGNLYIEHESGTTNGTVFSEHAEWTVNTPFGTVNCKTGFGTDIGTLTGREWGWSTLHINAVLNCGILLPSAKWQGTYQTTWAEGLGVSA